MSFAISISQFIVQNLISIIVHAFTFFLTIQYLYITIHAHEIRSLTSDVPLQSLSGFVTYVPLFFLSFCVPLFLFLKQIDGQLHKVADFSATSFFHLLRRVFVIYVCYSLAKMVVAPIMKNVISSIGEKWTADETKQHTKDSTFSITKKSSIIGMIAFAMVMYLVRVFSFTDHLNHLFSLAATGFVGVITVLGVFGLIFTTGMLIWTNPKVLPWISSIFLVALCLLPWWLLETSALTNPVDMMKQVFDNKVESPGTFFTLVTLCLHFVDFFITGNSGWMQLDFVSPLVLQLPIVMFYLSTMVTLARWSFS